MAEQIDHTKSYPWPRTPRKTPINVRDILDDLKANLAAKPARDAAFRAARDGATATMPAAPRPAVVPAGTFAEAPKEKKPGGK